METNILAVPDFITYTVGILVYFLGVQLTQKINWLQRYNIPEPVTGGILASLILLVIYLTFNVEVIYELDTRDRVLVYFFTAIGINAKISDLFSGGKPLIILLCLTLGYIVIQNVVGVSVATAIGQPSEIGVLTGSASLIGGHGTAIAWAPDIAEKHGITGALEIGVASATLGLIFASMIGGPIAKWLLSKHEISGEHLKPISVGIAYDKGDSEKISHVSIMGVILVIHIAIIGGYFLDMFFTQVGLKLPLFVSCLLVAIVLSNSVPYLLPKMHWPAHTKALALVSDFSLGLFIAMSLMSMQLWSIADLAGPLLILLGVQVLVTVLFILYIFFPLMGRNYLAVVLSAGFAGFSLGATPTAIANMTAVTKSHGAAHTAFIILPLVGAFFVDITNAFVIQWFLG